MIGVLIGSPVGLFLGWWLAYVAHKTRAPKHQHVWRVTSAQSVDLVETRNAVPHRRYTNVLKTCYCGETRVDEVEGHWTLRQLLDGQV